jgi:hypothetical protein
VRILERFDISYAVDTTGQILILPFVCTGIAYRVVSNDIPFDADVPALSGGQTTAPGNAGDKIPLLMKDGRRRTCVKPA